MARQMIALAGVGGLGKYICEELLADAKFDVVVISRAVDALVSVCIPLDGYKDCIAGKVLTKNITQEHRWASSHQVAVHQSDYSTESVLSILNLVQATALVSFVHLFDARWITIHTSFLSACRQSTSCKRFIPSEFVADAEKTPVSPAFYGSTRAPFREILRNPAHAEGVEWTLFNTGWFMDYLLPQKKTYIRHAISDCPIDVGAWQVNIKGTGDEAVSWVCGRDVGKAIVELLKAKKWVSQIRRLFGIGLSFDWLLQERSTYVSADWKTFNEVVNIMESFYGAWYRCLKFHCLSHSSR